jgi:uncharacterized protein (DUF1800 family)
MVKPPLVYLCGLLRARQRFVDGNTWHYNAEICGQRPYQPPDVGGWNDDEWLDSNRMLGRWQTAYVVNAPYAVSGAYDANETPEQAVTAAIEYWEQPKLRAETVAALTDFASRYVPPTPDVSLRQQRQNALRHLVAICPDYHVS